jgi:RNA-directed DNA polymerase
MFMHYGFDRWMVREHPNCPFERYADDVVVHCVNRPQAETVLVDIAVRMGEVGLALHPDKTRIVYGKDGKRRGSTNTPPSPFSDTASEPAGHQRQRGVFSTASFPP